jgi:hypothetical protein
LSSVSPLYLCPPSLLTPWPGPPQQESLSALNIGSPAWTFPPHPLKPLPSAPPSPQPLPLRSRLC